MLHTGSNLVAMQIKRANKPCRETICVAQCASHSPPSSYSKRVKDVETFCVLRVGAESQRLIPTDERSGLLTHRDDGKRFIVRADEKLTAFLELER